MSRDLEGFIDGLVKDNRLDDETKIEMIKGYKTYTVLL